MRGFARLPDKERVPIESYRAEAKETEDEGYKQMIEANISRLLDAVGLPQAPQLLGDDETVLAMRSEAESVCGGNVLLLMDEWGILDPAQRRDVRRRCTALQQGYAKADQWHERHKGN